MTRVESRRRDQRSSTPRPSSRIPCHHHTFAYGKLEIDAASSAAARLDFANTADDAVDDSRFYPRPPVAYVPARSRSAHKTRIGTFAKRKKNGTPTCDANSLRSQKQHEGPLTARLNRSVTPNRITAQRNMTFKDQVVMLRRRR